jgi:DNA-binding NarL/FixJ family response regulator
VLIAVIFLGVGVALALAVARRSSRRDTETKKAMILDQGDLSDRERDVLLFLVHGYTNKEISSNLNITQNTVKSHLKNIYAKLGVTNRTQAAAEAKLLGFVGAP